MSNPKFNAWQESKDLYGLMKLQQIADSQKQMAAAAGEQAKIAAEHAAALQQIEQARLTMEQQRLQKEEEKQALRRQLFSIEDGLRKVAAVEDEQPLDCYMNMESMAKALRNMKVEEVGEHGDLLTRSNLLNEIQKRQKRLQEKHPAVISKLMIALKHLSGCVTAALSLDLKWVITYRLYSIMCQTVMPAKIQKADEELNQKSTAPTAAKALAWSSIIAGLGGFSVLLALASFIWLGDDSIVNEKTGEVMTFGEKLFASIIFLMISLAWLLGGLYWRKRAKEKQQLQMQVLDGLQAEKADALMELERSGKLLQEIPDAPCHQYMRSLGLPVDPPNYDDVVKMPDADQQFIANLKQLQATLQTSLELRSPSQPFLERVAEADLGRAERLVKLLDRVQISCPSCKAVVAGKTEHAGKNVRCPKCSKGIKVPVLLTLDDEIRREVSEIITARDSVGLMA